MSIAVTVNYLAVVVAAIISMVIGSIWYGPLFGKMWMKMSGMTPEKMAEAKKAGMAKGYVMQAIASFVTAWVLAWIMGALNLTDLAGGVQAAIWTWLGFTATAMVGQMAWEKKSGTWFFVNGVGLLACDIGMGVVLGLWK